MPRTDQPQRILADRIEARVVDPANETSSEALAANIAEIIALVHASAAIPQPVVRPGDQVQVKNDRIKTRNPWEPGRVRSIHWNDFSGQGGDKWWRYRVQTLRRNNNVVVVVDDDDVRLEGDSRA